MSINLVVFASGNGSTLQSIIDAIDEKRLDAKICRYKEIYPYEKNIVEISNDHKYVNASYMHIFFLNSL